jgi:hypothetical protein
MYSMNLNDDISEGVHLKSHHAQRQKLVALLEAEIFNQIWVAEGFHILHLSLYGTSRRTTG